MSQLIKNNDLYQFFENILDLFRFCYIKVIRLIQYDYYYWLNVTKMTNKKLKPYPENARFIEVISDHLDKAYSAYAIAQELGYASKESTFYHLLANRNRLSLDILVKLCRRFPTVNPAYILLGIGEPLLSSSNPLEVELSEAKELIIILQQQLETAEGFNKLKDDYIESLKALNTQPDGKRK